LAGAQVIGAVVTHRPPWIEESCMECKERKCVDVPVAPPPDEGVRELVAVGLAAEACGWPQRLAFEAALLLKIHGTPTLVSVEAFMHAARVTQ
jgi:hypothetical protein